MRRTLYGKMHVPCLGAITWPGIIRVRNDSALQYRRFNSECQYLSATPPPTALVLQGQVQPTPRPPSLSSMAPSHPLASVPPPLPPGWTEHLGKIPIPVSTCMALTSPFLKQVLLARYTFSIHLPKSLPMFDPCLHFLLLHPRKRSRRLRHPFLERTGSE